jgi:hypothetical protein
MAPAERNPTPVQASASEPIVPPRIEATPEDQQLGNIELPVLATEGRRRRSILLSLSGDQPRTLFLGLLDPFEAAVWVVFAVLDAVAYAADRLTGWMWPHGTRARRLRLADWHKTRGHRGR